MKKYHILLFLFFFSVQYGLLAQDIRGKWVGTFQHKSCLNDKYIFAVSLDVSQADNELKAVFTIFDINTKSLTPSSKSIFQFNTKATLSDNIFKVLYNSRDEVYGRRFNYGYQLYGVFQLLLQYSVTNTFEKLVGDYGGSNGATGLIFLSRPILQNGTRDDNNRHSNLLGSIRAKQKERRDSVTNTIQQKKIVNEPFNNNTLPDSNYYKMAIANQPEQQKEDSMALENLFSRKLAIQQTIVIKDSSYADLAIYDNAVIDRDTISLFADSAVLLYKVQVASKPIQVRVYKPASKNSIQLRMFAENLGEIPPNTALIIITAGNFREAVRLKSDFYTNASIIIKWE